MPKRFTPEQFAASAAAGEPRIKQSFAGDTYAWHTYQDSYFRTLFGELTDASRADRWKKACRQREAIENQRTKAAADNVALVADENHDAPNQVHKRLKVSARWQAEHAAAILELDASAPHASINPSFRGGACTHINRNSVLRITSSSGLTVTSSGVAGDETARDLHELSAYHECVITVSPVKTVSPIKTVRVSPPSSPALPGPYPRRPTAPRPAPTR